jgi:predicted RNA-binding protein with EMAP domain
MAFTEPTQGIVEEGDRLVPYTANEDVIRGQVVKVAGADNAVQPSDTDGENTIGVATQTVSAGDQVTVALPGCEVEFTAGTGTISRGDFVTSHGATGNEGEVDSASATGDNIVGLVTEGSSSQGDLIRGQVVLAGEVN